MAAWSCWLQAALLAVVAHACRDKQPKLVTLNYTIHIDLYLTQLTFRHLNSAPLSLHSILNYHTPTRSLRSATLACCLFLMFALPLPPVALVLQSVQSGTHSHLAFVTLPLPILSITFLKFSASNMPLAPPSGSPKSLIFGHRLTL